jgi:hypothetical protein
LVPGQRVEMLGLEKYIYEFPADLLLCPSILS